MKPTAKASKRKEAPTPTRAELDDALTALEKRAPVPRGWSPTETAKALRGLRRRFARLAASSAASEIEWLERGRLWSRIEDLTFRARLAGETLKRWRRVLAQLQAFADRVRREPGRAYAYRRRRYHKLLKQKGEQQTILRLLGVALPAVDLRRFEPALAYLRAAFALVPPSRAEAHALRAHLTLADVTGANLSLTSCTGAACRMQRGEEMPAEGIEDLIRTCPGGLCALFRKSIDTAGPAWQSYSQRNGAAASAIFRRLSGGKNVN